MQKLASGLIALVLLAGLGACGDDDDDDDAAPAGGGEASTVEVTAKNLAFDPTTAEVAAGEVTFDITNEDDTDHTFTIDDADVDIQVAAGSSGSDTATLDAGTYDWRCTIHPSMEGTLTVT